MELLRSEFQKVDTNPIVVVVRYPKSYSPLSVDHVDRIYDLSRWLAKLPGVNAWRASWIWTLPSAAGNTCRSSLHPMPPLPRACRLL